MMTYPSSSTTFHAWHAPSSEPGPSLGARDCSVYAHSSSNEQSGPFMDLQKGSAAKACAHVVAITWRSPLVASSILKAILGRSLDSG